MLVIGNTTSLKSFEDFNNMFKAIYIYGRITAHTAACSVFSTVALECNPIRTNEVRRWLDGGWYPGYHQYDFSSDEESLSDITD